MSDIFMLDILKMLLKKKDLKISETAVSDIFSSIRECSLLYFYEIYFEIQFNLVDTKKDYERISSINKNVKK